MTRLITIASLLLCVGSAAAQEADAHLKVYPFPETPVLGTVPDMAGKPHDVHVGGFSGLTVDSVQGDVVTLVTHPDRGPNSEPTDLLPDVKGQERPFLFPDFQPDLIRFSLNLKTGEVKLLERVGLTVPTDQGSRRLTGLPNLQAGPPKAPFTDEVPVDLHGKRLPNDPLGADLEGVERDPRDGSYWLVDEYRPSIYHVSPQGVLIDRFVPEGTAAAAGVSAADSPFGRELLPAVFAQRRQNRGFEALAIAPVMDGGPRLFAFLQSPLRKGSQVSRVLELDLADAANPKVVGMYLYPLEEAAQKVEKIGDAGWLGRTRLAVVEQNSELGPEGRRYVTEVDLSGASNLLEEPGSLPAGTTYEDHSLEQLAGLGVRVLPKKRLFDLTAVGFEPDKVEGMTVVRGEHPRVILINDDDYGLVDEPIPGDGRQPFLDPCPRVFVGVLSVPGS